VLLAAALQKAGIRLQDTGPSVLLFNAYLAVVVSLAVVFVYCSAGYYPSKRSLKQSEETFLEHKTGWWADKIRTQIASRVTPDTKTILFLGSSQTTGAGAATENDSFVNRIQRQLDATAARGIHIACINAGINAANSSLLLKQYQDSWIATAPALVVINLGCNDLLSPKFEVEYAANLVEFARLNQEKGIRTLFVTEALSWENYPAEPRTHAIMQRVAAAQGIPVVTAGKYLDEYREKGFLWWDFVHPTSFGHRLIAQCIYAEIRKQLPSEWFADVAPVRP